MLRLVALVCLAAALPSVASAQDLTAEARANLKAAYTAEKAYYQEKDTYSDRVMDIGFWPERGNRYAYFFAESGPVARRSKAGDEVGSNADAVIIGPDELVFPKARVFTSVKATGCPVTFAGGTTQKFGVTPSYQGEFVILAAANLDDDADLDCWSIASFSRIGPDGRGVPSGEPLREKADLSPEQQEAMVADQRRKALQSRGITNPQEIKAWEDFSRLKPGLKSAATIAEVVRAGLPEKDPWGRPYVLVRFARDDVRDTAAVLSPGADGVVGTPDDIGLQLR